MKDFNGNDISIGDIVLFHPKGLSANTDHLAFGVVTRLTEKTVFVKYECLHYPTGRYRGKTKQGLKEYPRRFEQVYVVKKGDVK